MSAILELKDIFKSYPNGSHGRKNVLCGANLTVERGELVGLVGKSGCGKSALVDIALRLSDAIALIDTPRLVCLPVDEMVAAGHINRLFHLDLLDRKP